MAAQLKGGPEEPPGESGLAILFKVALFIAIPAVIIVIIRFFAGS